MKFTPKVLDGKIVGDTFLSLKRFSKGSYLSSKLKKMIELDKVTHRNEGVLRGSGFSMLGR